jgi:hypothetical protein
MTVVNACGHGLLDVLKNLFPCASAQMSLSSLSRGLVDENPSKLRLHLHSAELHERLHLAC